MSKATNGLHVDQVYTTLELIGGRDALVGAEGRKPDLLVHGGMRVAKSSRFDGLVFMTSDLTLEGNLTVLQNSYLANVFADNITTDKLTIDELCLGDIKANIVTANVVNTGSFTTDDLTVTNACVTDALQVDDVQSKSGNAITMADISINTIDAQTVNTTMLCAGTTKVTGDLTVDGDIFGNLVHVIGNCIQSPDASARVCVADGARVDVDGLTTFNGDVCITGGLQTDSFESKTGGNITVTSDVDIDAAQTLYVSTISGHSPITFTDSIVVPAITVAGPVIGGFQALAALDAGATLPGNATVCFLEDMGGVTGNFALEPPLTMAAGQVLHVYNNTAFDTTGNVITTAGSGATLVCNGSIWAQL